ncbi:MAG TPA: hypothetical protein VIP77_25420 [Jiangellaceae bacterium]
MSEPSSTPASDAPPTRHASWLELFFDLVVVAVAQVSHRLHDPTWAELGISFVEHPDATTTASTGALLCGGLAGYFAATTIAAMLEGAPRRWVLGWGCLRWS